jgi:hypothetical protein
MAGVPGTARAEGKMKNEVVVFDTNIWQQFALKYEKPREVPSPKNPADKRMMHTLVDGRVMFLKAESSAKITGLVLKPGELFEAAVLEKRNGPKKWVEFHVRRVDPPLQPQSHLEQGLRKSIDAIAAKKAAQPAAPAKPAPPPKPAPASGPQPRPPADADDPGPTRNGSNGLARHAANGHAANHIPAIPVNGSGESAVEIAMKAAIDVCANGQKYAETQGLHILFDGDMVCRILNTIQIGWQKR